MIDTHELLRLDPATTALDITDLSRCFFPAEEGERLGEPGYGELGVPGSEVIIPPINDLTRTALLLGMIIVHTEDAHPRETAHFSDKPNFINTWPRHSVAGTPGAMLHSDSLIAQRPGISVRFIKGDQAIDHPDQDTSYTGALAHQPGNSLLLPDYLRQENQDTVILCGQTIGDGNEHPLCVDSTAIDFVNQGFNVVLATDTVEPVLPENKALCFSNLGKIGVKLANTEHIVAALMNGAGHEHTA